jgi:energy-coupling factor transporter transmembrane protein EcfT
MADLDDKKGSAHENLLEILDNVIHQLDFTKKMAIVMVLSFIIIVPISAVVIGVLSESNRDLGVAIPIIWAAVFLVWLGVGIRQWIVFSRWTQKYRLYKELQKKLDERLDFESQDQGRKE